MINTRSLLDCAAKLITIKLKCSINVKYKVNIVFAKRYNILKLIKGRRVKARDIKKGINQIIYRPVNDDGKYK
jgi:hypothetical protein